MMILARPYSQFQSRTQSVKALKEIYARAGKECQLIGASHLPYIKNVGLAERKVQHDGKIIFVIHPAMHFYRVPRLLRNIKDDDGQLIFDHAGNIDWMEKEYYTNRPGISQECIKKAEYYFEDGLRKVRPYYNVQDFTCRMPKKGMTFQCHIEQSTSGVEKRRQFCLDFISDWYVNHRPAKKDTVLKHRDVVSSVMHRHESPISDEKVEIIFEDDDTLVVNKPSTMPISPISTYRYNTLLFILTKEHGYKDVRNVNRIDKDTSGICILAKGHEGASKLNHEFAKERVLKEYLALVDGEFPDKEITVDLPLPTNHLLNRVGNRAEKKPVEAVTDFRKLEYYPDLNVTLVSCFPKTGRTHQIRKHLLSLGYPVVNDAYFNQRDLQRGLLYKNLKEEAIEIFYERGRMKTEPMKSDNWMLNLSHNLGQNAENCPMCAIDADRKRRIERESVFPMCLHAVRYVLGGKTFETQWPKWATDRKYLLENVLGPRGITNTT